MKIKPVIIALVVLLGAGCQSQNPGIVRLSTDTYVLSRKDYRGIYGDMNSLKDGVIRDANIFAQEQGKIAAPISTKEHPVGILGDWASFEYQFKVVDAPRANVVIEKADVVIQKTENTSNDNRIKDETDKQADLSTELAESLSEYSNTWSQIATGSANDANGVVSNASTASVSMDDLKRKAEAGDVKAQRFFFLVYNEGMGVPQDSTEAMKWLRMAVEQDDAWAQRTLGRWYERGRGVPQDYVEAYKWYNLAASQGFAYAESWRDHVAQLMTREQIAEGQRRASQFVAQHEAAKAPSQPDK